MASVSFILLLFLFYQNFDVVILQLLSKLYYGWEVKNKSLVRFELSPFIFRNMCYHKNALPIRLQKFNQLSFRLAILLFSFSPNAHLFYLKWYVFQFLRWNLFDLYFLHLIFVAFYHSMIRSRKVNLVSNNSILENAVIFFLTLSVLNRSSNVKVVPSQHNTPNQLQAELLKIMLPWMMILMWDLAILHQNSWMTRVMKK